MIKKKNGFMTFICSLIPGAGEMYLGFMKEGLSIMCLTFGMFIGSTFLNIDWFIYGVIIIWFYSLFNVHNKVSLTDEEFYMLEDRYLFQLESLLPEGKLNGKQSRVFGWILLFLGISIIWRPSIRNLLAVLRTYISSDFADVVGNYLYSIPQFIIAAILIISGVRMILKKKSDLDTEQELFPENDNSEK